MKKRLIVTLGFVLTAFTGAFVLSTPDPAYAQLTCPWEYDFNIASGDGGWTVYNTGGTASYSAGAWHSGDDDNTGGSAEHFQRIYIKRTFTSTTITRVRLSGNVASYGLISSPATEANYFIADSNLGVFGSNHNLKQLNAKWPVGNFSDDQSMSVTADTITLYLAVGTNVPSPPGGSGTITSIIFDGTGSINPFTGAACPTPTPTPTLAPPPVTPVGGPIGPIACSLLTANVYQFSKLPGVWAVNKVGALGGGVIPANPPGTTVGMMLWGGQASTSLTLSSYKQYTVHFDMHVTDPGGGITADSFTVAVGKSPYITVPVAAQSGEQSFDIPASNFMPDGSQNNGGGTFTLSLVEQLWPSGNSTLTIDDMCISDVSPNGSNGVTAPTGGGASSNGGAVCVGTCGNTSGTFSQASGAVCGTPTLTIYGALDALSYTVAWIQWLWNDFRAYFGCVLNPMIYGIWTDLVRAIQTVVFGVQFVVANIGPIIAWFNSLIGAIFNAFILGSLADLEQRLFNAVWILLRAIGLQNVVNTILAVLSNLPQFITIGAQIIGTVVGAATSWITLIIQTITNALTAVPILFLSIITGFNAASTAMPIYAPVCSDPSNAFYGECLIFYISDNTILAGPIYYIFLAIEGAIAAIAVMWAIRYSGKQLSR